MNKAVIAFLLTVSSQAFACPDLSGKYMVSSSSTLYVTQGYDDHGGYVYNFTTKDEACRRCEYTNLYRADGRTTRRDYADGIRIEWKTVSCDGNKLKIRQTTETYDGRDKVATFTDHYDYSLNSRGGLVEEEIKDGRVYRSSTHYRLAP